MSRAIVAFLAKVLIAAAILWWLVSSGRLSMDPLLGRRWSAGDIAPLAAAAALVVVGLLLVSLRLRLLLAATRMPLSFPRVLGFTSVGALVGAVLPGLIGADAVRTAYLWGSHPSRKAAAVTVVLIDRALGLLAMLLVASLVLLVPEARRVVPSELAYFWVGAALFGCAGMTAFAIPALRESSTMTRAVGALPRPLAESLDSVRQVSRSLPTLAAAMGLSIANQATLVAAYIVVDHFVLSGISVVGHFALDPIVMVTTAVPITPGGIGVAESAAEELYRRAGASGGAEMALSMRMLQYAVWTVLGTISLVLLRMKSSSRSERR